MKTNSIKTVISIFLLISIFSCKNDDDQISLASINFITNDIDATFFQPGNSMPTVNWNGEVGAFQLTDNYIDGISELAINETTGELSWTHLLEEGIWVFFVEATNSAGTTVVEMSIDNTLQGDFAGTYSSPNEHYFAMQFFKDGTVIVGADDFSNPSLATGTWQIDGANQIKVNYTYNVSGNELSTLGLLEHSGSGVSYSGTWFNNHDALPGNEGGLFDIQMAD